MTTTLEGCLGGSTTTKALPPPDTLAVQTQALQDALLDLRDALLAVLVLRVDRAVRWLADRG